VLSAQTSTGGSPDGGEDFGGPNMSNWLPSVISVPLATGNGAVENVAQLVPFHAQNSGCGSVEVPHAHSTRWPVSGSTSIDDASTGAMVGVGSNVHVAPVHRHVVFVAPVAGGGPTQQATASSDLLTGSNDIGL
jgi:hypothetical protein